MKRLINYVIFLSAFALLVNVAFAANPPPLQMVSATTSQMLAALKRNKQALNNRRVIRRIVKQIVVPKMDVTTIAASVVGRNHWNTASSAQRSRFISVFTDYVIDMYSSALSAYQDETILFRPMRSFSPSQSTVQIFSVVRRSGAPQVQLNYRLVKRASGWRIYDFSVDGVSMVHSYRAQFADTLSQQGITVLTNRLQQRNL